MRTTHLLHWLAVASSLALAGCGDDTTSTADETGSTSGDDDTTSSTTTTTPDTSTSGEETGVPTTLLPDSDDNGDSDTGFVPGECPDVDLGENADVVEASLEGSVDDYTSICAEFGGFGEGEDFAVAYQPPRDGIYRFSVEAESFGPLLAILEADEACPGEERFCNLAEDRIVVQQPQDAGSNLILMVDSAFGTPGDFTLSVEELAGGTCPDVDLGTMGGPAVASGSTMGAGWDAALCGSEAGEDVLVQFEAPEAGGYSFDASASSFGETLVGVLDGCAAPAQSCSIDAAHRWLNAGEVITVAIAGNNDESGDYSLDVTVHPIDASCADGDVMSDLGMSVAAGTTGDVDDDFTLSCAAPDIVANDVTYTFTAPAAGTYVFDTVGSAIDTVLAVNGPVCAVSAEIGCNDDDFQTENLDSVVAVDLADAQQVIVAIEGYAGERGDFMLNIAVNETTGGSCCETGDTGGCDAKAVESCVCADVPECCDEAWDSFCVDLARGHCDASCVEAG